MRFIITTDPLNSELTGVGNYTKNLIDRSKAYLPKNNIYFYNAGLITKQPRSFYSKNRTVMKIKRKLNRLFSNYDREFKETDLFHGTNQFIPPQVKKSIVTIHDLSIFHYPETHPEERVRFFNSNFLETINKSSHIITVSKTIKNELVKYLSIPEKKITPIYLASKFNSLKRDNEYHIPRCLNRYSLLKSEFFLYVGTLEPRKNLKRLITAYLNLPLKIKNKYPLVLVGDGGWKSNEVKLLIQDNKKYIRYLGYLSEYDIEALYKSARIFLYPSFYEGFGLPICEAMSCGTDIVISNIKVFKELYPSAHFFDPYDDKSITQAIMVSLEMDIIQEKLLEMKYNWEICAKETFSLYKTVLNDKNIF